MKKATYQSKVFTVEDTRIRNEKIEYKLSGIGWVKKSECTHWLSGWLNQHFNNAAFNRFLITLIGLGLTTILFRCIL